MIGSVKFHIFKTYQTKLEINNDTSNAKPLYADFFSNRAQSTFVAFLIFDIE